MNIPRNISLASFLSTLPRVSATFPTSAWSTRCGRSSGRSWSWSTQCLFSNWTRWRKTTFSQSVSLVSNSLANSKFVQHKLLGAFSSWGQFLLFIGWEGYFGTFLNLPSSRQCSEREQYISCSNPRKMQEYFCLLKSVFNILTSFGIPWLFRLFMQIRPPTPISLMESYTLLLIGALRIILVSV